jgi:hypothetical protein
MNKRAGIAVITAAGIVAAIALARKKAAAVPPPPPPEVPPPGVPPPAGTATVYGIVVDGTNGEPIEGIEVNCNGYTAVTDSSGRYYIEGIPPGGYTITFTDPLGRYQQGQVSMYLYAGQTVPLTAYLQPPPPEHIPGTATLEVIVIENWTRRLIDGATVILDGTVSTTTRNGHAFFYNIAYGQHTIEVSHPDIKPAGITVTVSEDSVTVSIVVEYKNLTTGLTVDLYDAETKDWIANSLDLRHFDCEVTLSNSTTYTKYLHGEQIATFYDIPYEATKWTLKVEPYSGIGITEEGKYFTYAPQTLTVYLPPMRILPLTVYLQRKPIA